MFQNVKSKAKMKSWLLPSMRAISSRQRTCKMVLSKIYIKTEFAKSYDFKLFWCLFEYSEFQQYNLVE